MTQAEERAKKIADFLVETGIAEYLFKPKLNEWERKYVKRQVGELGFSTGEFILGFTALKALGGLRRLLWR